MVLVVIDSDAGPEGATVVGPTEVGPTVVGTVTDSGTDTVGPTELGTGVPV